MGTETGQRKISLGDTVKLKFENGEVKSYTVVSSDKTDPGNGFISNMCPIGEAVIGASVGEKKKYLVRGEESEIEIVEVQKTK